MEFGYDGDGRFEVKSHEPRRGDEVEAWIKRQRDEHAEGSGTWHTVDDLLDDYREHADTGTPLHAEVQGPHGEEGA